MTEDAYKTSAKPKAVADGVPVFCACDAVVATDEVKPNPRNPNEHPYDQVKMLGGIIRRTGWRAPITVSTLSGYVVKGHCRLMAARLEGLQEVPVDYQDYSSKAEELADLTADNRIAEFANINDTKLNEILTEITDSIVPIDLTGYTAEECENLAATLAETMAALDLDEERRPAAGDEKDQDEEAQEAKKIYRCPKCGFEFEAK